MTRPWPLTVDVPTVAPRWGVEQEYQVLQGSEQLDFRVLLEDVAGDLVRRDPGDPRARRLGNGLGLTADGWEAELVTPPLVVGAAQLAELGAMLATGEAELAAELPRTRLVGFSTHLNVSVPDDDCTRIARSFSESCAALVDALVEPAERTGVMVRPRRGRLEVGTDHLTGPPLLSAISLVAACARGIGLGERPPGPTSHVVPSREKFGFFVPPDDLEVASGALVDWVRPHLDALGLSQAPADLPTPPDPPTLDLGPRERLGWRLTCAWLTWGHSVWSVVDPGSGRQIFAVVPAASETDFVSRLDAGLLDDQISRAMRGRRRPVLAVHRQIEGPALWSEVRPGALVPAERLFDGSVPRVSRRDMAAASRRGGSRGLWRPA